MNKTFKRALPVFVILVAIIVVVIIFSMTNKSTVVPSLEDRERELYTTSINDTDISVTKEEVYNQLKYDQTINEFITNVIDTEYLTNEKYTKIDNGDLQKELRGNDFNFNYIELIKNDTEMIEDIEEEIIQTILGTSDEDEINKLTQEEYDEKIDRFLDTNYLTYFVTFNTTNHDEIVSQILANDSLSDKYIIQLAKNEYINDVLLSLETTKDDSWYLTDDQWDRKYRDRYREIQSETKYSEAILINFNNNADFERAIELLGYKIEEATIVETALDSEGNTDISDDEFLQLYIKLYDYLYSYTRHGSSNVLENYINNNVSGISSINDVTGSNYVNILDALTDEAESNPFNYSYKDEANVLADDDGMVEGNYFVHYSVSIQSTSSSLDSYMFNTLNTQQEVESTEGDNDEIVDGNFTDYNKSYASQRYMVYMFDKEDTYPEEWEDFKEEETSEDLINDIQKQVQDDYNEELLTESFVINMYNEKVSGHITIYDKLIEKIYAASNSDYESSSDVSTDNLLRIGSENFTADYLYQEMKLRYELITINKIAEQKIITASPLFTEQFGEERDVTVNDTIDMADLKEQARNIKASFASGQDGTYPDDYGWIYYLNHKYNVNSERELLELLAYQQIQPEFSIEYFTTEGQYDSITPVEDGKGVVDHTSTEFREAMVDLLDEHFSPTAGHVLVSISDTNDETILKDPLDYGTTITSEWDATQVLWAEFLLDAASEHAQGHKDGIELGLQDFVTRFNESEYGSVTVPDESICLTDPVANWKYDEDCFGFVKSIGLEIKHEDLGSFQKGAMVSQFEERTEVLIARHEDALTGEDAEEEGFLDTSSVATTFGYHLIHLKALTEAATAEIDQDELDIFNRGLIEVDKISNDFLNTEILPTDAQLELYIEQRDDENKIISLPSDVQSAIEFYYGGVRNNLISATMYSHHILNYFVNEGEYDTESYKTSNDNLMDIYTRQNDDYNN